MTWTISEATDPAACFALRHTVFVEEQGVPVEEEQDALDETAVHLLASLGDKVVGAARVVMQDQTAKIGRVCVAKDQRGTGLGAGLIDAGIAAARRRGAKDVVLGAQVSALGFYERLGFVAFGPVFDDAGIDHQMMRRAV